MLAADVPVCVPGLTLHRGGLPVTGRGAVLEMNSRGQSMWIE